MMSEAPDLEDLGPVEAVVISGSASSMFVQLSSDELMGSVAREVSHFRQKPTFAFTHGLGRGDAEVINRLRWTH